MSLLLDLLFPKNCFSCHRPGSYLCPYCQAKETVPPINYHLSPFEGVVSLFPYSLPIKNLILSLKYHHVTSIASFLGPLIRRRLKTHFPHLLHYWRQHHFSLAPVPLHPNRQNHRGFNQSELIASSFSSAISLPCLSSLYRKNTNTVSQTRLASQKLRFSNPKSTFSVSPVSAFPSKLIIVDDVITTGSTLSSLAKTTPPSTLLWGLTVAG